MIEFEKSQVCIPARLRPTANKEAVTVRIGLVAKSDLSNAQIEELKMKWGLVCVTAQFLKPLARLGCSAEHLGLIRTRGGILLTQQAPIQAITAAVKIGTSAGEEYDVTERLKSGRLVGYLTAKLIDAHIAREHWIAAREQKNPAACMLQGSCEYELAERRVA